METASVGHHGRETAYRHRDVGGKGLALLCVHGSDDAHGVRRGQFRLVNDYPVAALDLSSRNGSDDVGADAGHEMLSVYIDDMVAMAEETDVNILVGNSFGGAAVLALALGRGLGLDALVLAGMGMKLAVLSDLLDQFENDFDRAVPFLHGEDELFHIDDERPTEGPKEAIYGAEQAVALRDFLSCHMSDVHDGMNEISMPTPTFVGEYGRLTPPSYHECLAEMMPNGELGTAEDVAYLAMLERPAAFNETVKSFLNRRVA